MNNVEQTIISQYGNSATITQLIQNMNQYIDPSADINNFYSNVWDITQAQGFGLDIWGRIVNISRSLNIANNPIYFGFNEALPGSYPFGDEPFYDNSAPATQVYLLGDDAYRKLILVKALANISATNASSINQLLQNLFAGRGRCYVNDLGNMSMRYTFEFLLSSYEFAIVTQSGALPRPAGVSASLINTVLPVFGFSEAGVGYGNFADSTFISQNAQYAIN